MGSRATPCPTIAVVKLVLAQSHLPAGDPGRPIPQQDSRLPSRRPANLGLEAEASDDPSLQCHPLEEPCWSDNALTAWCVSRAVSKPLAPRAVIVAAPLIIPAAVDWPAPGAGQHGRISARGVDWTVVSPLGQPGRDAARGLRDTPRLALDGLVPDRPQSLMPQTLSGSGRGRGTLGDFPESIDVKRLLRLSFLTCLLLKHYAIVFRHIFQHSQNAAATPIIAKGERRRGSA